MRSILTIPLARCPAAGGGAKHTFSPFPMQDLQKVVNLRKAAAAKVVKEQAKERAEAERKRQESADKQAYQRIYRQKVIAAFTAPWVEGGHPALKTMTKQEWVDALKNYATSMSDATSEAARQDPFSRPVVVEGIALPEGLKETMDKWTAAHKKHSAAKDSSRNQAPMKAEQVLLCTELISELKGSTCVDIEVPSLKASCAQVLLTGFTTTMHCYDFEPLMLGSARILHKGEMYWLGAPASSLQKAFLNLGLKPENGKDITLADLKKVFEHCETSNSKDDLISLKKDCRIFHGKVKENSCLITPAGWLVGMCTAGDTDVTGIRFSFLPQSDTAYQGVEATLAMMDQNESGALFKALRATLDNAMTT